MKRSVFMLFVLGSSINSFGQCACSNVSNPISVGETGSSSLVLNKGQWMAELHAEYRNYHMYAMDLSAMHDHSMTDMQYIVSAGISTASLRFGITDRLTVSAVIPYILLNVSPQNANGIGDMNVLAGFKIFEKNRISGAAFGGIKLPTGIRSNLNSESGMTIGTGSYDPILGLALVQNFMKSSVRASVSYKYGTYGFDQINYGSSLNHDLSFAYQLNPCGSDSTKIKDSFSCMVFAALNGEMNTQQFKSATNFVPNTGGYTLYGKIGTSLSLGKWSMPVSFFIPIAQSFNGMQSKINYKIKLGIIKTF